MEKLIELLNEYLWENWGIKYHIEHHFDFWDKKEMLTDEFIISKRCGFIKWLCENNKVDVNGDITIKLLQDSVFANEYEWLLIMLATSDTPIKDLISYLK